MRPLKVVYYAQLYYLDSSIETINCIKDDVEIHLLIEVTPDSINSTFLDFKEENIVQGFNIIQSILTETSLSRFNKISNGLKSCNIYFIKSKKVFSFGSLISSCEISAFINALQPDVLHLDSSSLRILFSLPFLKKYKKIITIHDPLSHSGEFSWKNQLCLKLYLNNVSDIVLYSSYAQYLFKKVYKKEIWNIFQLKLLPYRSILNENISGAIKGSYILFFGRLSIYKGIDILFKALPTILDEYPDEKFVIAGKPEMELDIPDNFTTSVKFILNHLSVDELNNLVTNAKFIVCPYRDATQSGVLMTCFAFNKSVVATNVGAFPEYITDGINGLLCQANEYDLAHTIIKALDNNYYLKLNKNILKNYTDKTVNMNQLILKKLYAKQ